MTPLPSGLLCGGRTELRECRISGLGIYRPVRSVPNSDIAAVCGVSAQWIHSRTGVERRGIAGPDETLTMMAAAAGRQACARQGAGPGAIGAVIVATFTHTRQVPSLAPSVAHALGCRNAAAYDLAAGCAGFCYGLAAARDYLRSGTADQALVIGVERISDIVDPADRATAPIFGDGAGAVLVSVDDSPGVGPVLWGCDGTGDRAITMTASWEALLADPAAPAPVVTMDGGKVWHWVRRSVAPAIRKLIDALGDDRERLRAFIPHQANDRIIDMLVSQLDLPAHVAVARDITTAGNTSAASIPLAMHALLADGHARTGDLALLAGFGAGLTYAAQLVTLP
jgi:3-oxoacyl-(acyl-carrier-protein) synthase III